MKKRLLLLLAVILLGSSAILAQKKLYFCSDYSEYGEPSGIGTIWNITPKAGNVYMLYKNGGEKIYSSIIYVFIDKLNTSGDYKEYATKSLVPYKFMNWVLYDYKFTEAGEYKVKFLDDEYHELASEYCTIKMKDESSTATTTGTSASGTSSADKADWNYYKGSKIQFCEEISSSGEAITPSDVFNIPTGGAYVYVLVNAYKELKTTQFVVDVYKGDDYKTFVETKNYDITPTSPWTFFKYSFFNTGKYKFAVYNKDWIPIGTAYVTINPR